VSKNKIWQPFIIACAVALGIYIGIRLSAPYSNSNDLFSFRTGEFNKLSDVINYISQEYVDSVDAKELVETTISDMLSGLDPHSNYIPAADLQATNEPLEGNFEGIGIEFHIQDDTIMVVSAIAGGPSEQLGIRAGDRIIKVDGKNVAHIDISNTQVMKMLRGKGGTKVKVTIYRRTSGKTMDFTIVRGQIPIHSVDVGYMLSEKTGYIKVSHFGENTHQEYVETFLSLQGKGMQNLVLDLRGNPGGYLKTAIDLADEFLPNNKLIVYTEGRSRPRESFYATSSGRFENGNLVVLIDEGSASASEIVSGALQDWDRATIIGRRSFGKGLVQEQSEFTDGSAIRLTVARYFTPTGRCIQKPYGLEGEDYDEELYLRLKHGELVNEDSIHFADSLRFKTPGGKTVYGGGGIMPDIFIPLDTNGTSGFYSEVNGSGLIIQYAYDYLDQHRTDFEKYKSFKEFNKGFSFDRKQFNQFVEYAIKNKVSPNVYGIDQSYGLVSVQLKALIARQLWKNEGFYPIIQELDPALKKAVAQLEGSSYAFGKKQ
jgi:carboxyl-terminal processing protease